MRKKSRKNCPNKEELAFGRALPYTSMKRIFIFAVSILLSCSLMVGEKVLQSSAKHAPKWIGAMEEGYFIASAEAPTLDEAQQKALTRVR